MDDKRLLGRGGRGGGGGEVVVVCGRKGDGAVELVRKTS